MSAPAARQRKKLIADVFDRAATTYDSVAGSYLSVFGSRLVQRVDVSTGDRILDVACGKGATALPAAAQAAPTGAVLGFDLSIEMVRAARAKAADQGLENLTVAVMDAENISVRSASADVVICGFSMHFLPNPLRAIEGFARILADGGKVAISEWAPMDQSWAWEDELIGELPVKGVSSGSFDTAEALEDILSAAGLRDIQIAEESLAIDLADEEEWWRWKWSYSFRHVLEELDASARDRFKAKAFENLRAMRKDEGGIPLRLNALMALARKEG
jgi:ubiquinone/menaquinone biosynthesis C-methylase UbiE